MYVRYLQHQHHGTVQLLMMPLSTAADSVKSSKWSEKAESDDNAECEPVPLPIQTFLWRQTKPFLGAQSPKLHEASSVTFERVVVQNILHGLSPSLSDAIASVSRWRFVRAAFPHIVQCCSALLNDRADAMIKWKKKRKNSNGTTDDDKDPPVIPPVSGPLAKILYILHWLLIDAAAECNETSLNESSDGTISVPQLAFSVASIQLFVYLLAPLFQYINEEEIESHIRLESGLRLWQALWQYRTPDVLCFCAPVKQRKSQLPQVTLSKKLPAATAVEQGIYLGDENSAANRRLSQVPQISLTIPPPKPPRTDLNVLWEIQQKQLATKQQQQISDDEPPPVPTEPPPLLMNPQTDESSKQNCSIVRSVSDYKTNEDAAELHGKLNLKKSRTDVFHKSPDYSDSDIFNGLNDIDEVMRFAEDQSLSDIFRLNDRAPLVKLQEICSAASIDNSDVRSSNGTEPICSNCRKRVIRNPTSASDRCVCNATSEQTPVHGNGVVKSTMPVITAQADVPDDSSSIASQQTVINCGPKKQSTQQKPPALIMLENAFRDSQSVHSSDKVEGISIDPHDANYLDIGVLRCLLIENWNENGVYWSLKYLLNRLTDIRHYRVQHEGTFRSRSNSVPTVAPRGSRHDIRDAEQLTWSDLQEDTEILPKRSVAEIPKPPSFDNEDGNKHKVAFFMDKKENNNLGVANDKRRVSVNTLPATKKVSRTDKRRVQRSRSESTSTRQFEPDFIRPLSTNEQSDMTDSKTIQQNYYPEAVGSATFIEKTGQISLLITIKILAQLIERTNVIDNSELALNICDIVLFMPNIHPQSFFEDIMKIILKIYVQLGCPNGCGENSVRTPQANFLRIKAKNLLAQMHKISSTTFVMLLKQQVDKISVQRLLDCIHAITVYCQGEMGPHRQKKDHNTRRRSSTVVTDSTRVATYRNHFNESHSGIEGVFIDTLLMPLTSKVVNNVPDLHAPENMGLYQDIRMFMSHVDDYHGNPLRRTALSSLAARINADEDKRIVQDNTDADISECDSVRQSLSVGNSHSRDNASLRRGLFKKRDKLQIYNDDSEGESSPSTPRDVPSAEDTVSNSGSPLMLQQLNNKQPKKSGSKLQFAFNLLKSSVKNEASEDENWNDDMTAMTTINVDDEGDSYGNGFDNRSNRISFRNAAQRVNYFRQRQSLSTDASLSDNISTKDMDPNQPSLPNLHLPSKRMVFIKDVREGARRFAFLLETCKPGHVPDAPLLSAVSELKAPVLGRAVILLECAHFVSRCNRGEWPEWIKSGSTQPRGYGPMPTGSGSGSRVVTGGSRRAFLMQRAAGRNFYEWALQIGIRLQIALEREDNRPKEDKKKLKMLDDLENFVDDGTVNDNNGDGCPVALQMMSCMLLLQITSFLRETFQLIPRAKIMHTNKGSTSGWEKLMSHRRWSILSNTFNQNTGSIHSINDLHPSIQPIGERRVSYSTADEESSPRGSHDLIEEPPLGQNAEKKDANHALSSLRRFASRSRLFSREASFSTTDDGSERGSTRSRVLRAQQTYHGNSPGAQPASVISPFNIPEPVRRLAQGRQRLLKRGSPSGQPPSSLESSHKNRQSSFRHRKQSRSPAATDADDIAGESAPLMLESENSFAQQRRKTTSLRSSMRWNLRSTRIRSPGARPGATSAAGLPPAISTIDGQLVSTTSVPGGVAPNGRQRDSLKPSASKNSGGGGVYDENMTREPGIADHFSPERRTIGSYSSSQHGGPPLSAAPQLAPSIEDSEEEMIKNMPWIRTMIEFSKRFDMECTHQKGCSRWCFERVYRQCFRLVEAFQVVYDDKPEEMSDKRKMYCEGWQSKHDFQKQKRVSNPRRESAVVRQSGVERLPSALRGLMIEKLGEIEETKSNKKESSTGSESPVDSSELDVKPSAISQFIKTQLLTIAHAPLSTLLKSALIMTTDQYKAIIPFSWRLLLHNDAHVVATAASMFICCSVRCSDEAIKTIKESLASPDTTTRTSAIRRFFALWRNRFHVWLKMEDGAQLVFKVPPPGIDFTLPSPPIGQAQLPVVDSPWMPHVKTKVEELSLKEEEHSTSQTIMTMTRTRRKQKQEMVKRAVREAEERQCELRQQFPLRATAIVQQAAYEPALFHHQTAQQQQQQAQAQQGQGTDGNGDDEVVHTTTSRHQMPVSQPLFPSAILSVVPQIIEMLDDVQVDQNGVSVSDTCRKVIWNCITEDSSLFLRHFLEKLTNKDKQEYLIAQLRKLILTFRPLPSQTAYALLNYMFGFVMFYVRSPSDGSDKTLAQALSLIWLVAPYVHGLYFKDLKQTLKKEQCDQALMITANVPSAKKIIVHGPDSSTGGIPSQFPIHEDTQFQQILTDSLEFFNIPEEELDSYFLVDTKTGLLHNPNTYVRDFYFFHRSFYPQLTLTKLDPTAATIKMRQTAFQQKLIEIGKVLLTHNALKYSPELVIPQRIFFLHDEFTHLPSFPRRSLESCFGMYQGPLGEELQSIDSMHKYVWSKLMTDMFEKMENAFMFGDLHLFINVINGIMILHCEDLLILRRCMATYITMAIHFNTLFASQGFFLIMPTILRCYSQRQTNRLFTQVVEFACKQFYILHRKPFLLQMFGSVADICDQNNNDLEINAMLIKAKYLFTLMRSMENMNDLVDQLDILSLVPYMKPLKALDLCYRDDPNAFYILTDAMASCVTVCAFSPESRRSHQMLLVMQALMPYYIQFLEKETSQQSNAPAAVKHEIHAYNTMCVEVKALINSCESLCRGPTRTFDLVNTVSDRGKSFIADSPQFFDPPTVIEEDNKINKDKKTTTASGYDANADNTEVEKDLFRGPRDALLTLCALFIEKAGPRLKELTKLAATVEHVKVPELLDHKCHVKLSEIALSLLKVAPYDPNTMSCQGLQKYFMIILPVSDWSVETNRSALNIILRRLDKAIAKIGKKLSIRRRANWTAISNWLTGLYNTLAMYPYIAHLHPLKTITQMCLRLTVGDISGDETVTGAQATAHSNPSTILNASTPPPIFCNAVLKLTSFLMQALGQFAFSLEFVCSADGVGIAAERLEAVLCHVLIPLFLRAAIPGKENPQFQQKDIVYCLTVLHNAISPPQAKTTLAPVTSTTLATSLIRGTHDTAGRQGSVSVTDRGHSATVSTHRIVRDSVVHSVFLALKAMIIAFQKQMSTHWTKVARIVKDLVGKRMGGTALFSFLDFLLTINLPISLMVIPIVQNKLNQKPLTEQEILWQQELRSLIFPSKPKENPFESVRGYHSLLSRMSTELQTMKEDFASRLIELPRSHTPTIGELHSDSGSAQSGTGHRPSRPLAPGERRMSTTGAFGKLRKSTPTDGTHNVQDMAILEDTEDEMAQMIGGKVTKSPSLPFNRISINQSRRSIGGIGMWRSIRRKSRLFNDETRPNNLEMREIHRRTRSWNKRLASKSNMASDESITITPLTMPELNTRSDLTTSTSSKSERTDSEKSSHPERQRIVSFSTPKKSPLSQSVSNADSDEFCITSRQHLI
uniref:UNC80 domain-containing protein n=1 Tax=Panagrellus redivivus TaxID=6233 RepID=A0A7E4W3C8_PANRE